MLNNSTSVLRLPTTPQYGVIIEDIEKIQDSLFLDIYKRAIVNVINIASSSALREQSTSHSRAKPLAKEEFLNTVIAFTGDRGSGKSSAMLTFARILKNNTNVMLEPQNIDFSKKKFWVLHAMDATQMGKNEHLLASVSARMYKEFQKHSSDGKIPHGITIDAKRDFLSQVQKVNRLSIMCNNDDWSSDESVLLQNITELSDIRESVQELVVKFLRIMFGNCDENTFIVISIDDLDMNLTTSYEIVDEIRKFFTIPHVIVLTSVCVEQFRELVSVHFQKPFKDSNKSVGFGKSNTAEVLAQKYVEKMFPISRQMEMPKLTTEQLSRIYIENLLGGK